jgi:hypothetical protein
MATAKRHGDVLILPVRILPENVKAVTPGIRNGKFGFTAALGEVTGHAHVVEKVAEGIECYEDASGTLYLVIPEGLSAPITHEEHNRIDLVGGPGGSVFSINIQREYSPSGWSRVAD